MATARSAAEASAISAAAARVSMRAPMAHAPAPKDAAPFAGSAASAFARSNSASLRAGADASQQLGAAGFGASPLAANNYGGANRTDANGREFAADPFAIGAPGAAAQTASAFAAPNYPNGAAVHAGAHAGGGALHGNAGLAGNAAGNASLMSHAASSTAGLQMATASVPPARKRGVPWGPLAMLAAALAFGATGAIVVFYKKPPPPSITIVETQVTAPGVAPEVPTIGSTSSSSGTVLPAITATGNVALHGTSSGAIAANTPNPKASASASTGAVDLKGLIGSGATGPANDTRGPGSSGGGGSLTSEDMQRTVSASAPGVKRRCWDGAAATGSVSVTVNGTVGGDGHVQSASASGNDPAVAKCIENAVRSWKFPATGGTSTFSIPFKFVRQ
jgi:hypothetical protein